MLVKKRAPIWRALGIIRECGFEVESKKQLGRGYFTRVFGLKDGRVAQVTTDYAKVDWTEFARFENNPHLPIVDSVEWVDKDCWLIVGERLEHDWRATIPARLHKGAYGWGRHILTQTDLELTRQAVLARGMETLADAYALLLNWLGSDRYQPDIHSKNLMVRPVSRTLVINDPVVMRG